MITREAIRNLLDGLETAKKLAYDELESIREEKQSWIQGSEENRMKNAEMAGIARIIQLIEKQQQQLEEKNDSRRSPNTTTSISHKEAFYKRLDDVNDFLEQYTIHDDNNYDMRITHITYDEYDDDEFIAYFDLIPWAEDPREARREE